jgi:site-specific DNA-methyltransferase (adenine-specific)
MNYELFSGDNKQVLAGIPDNTYDACITDPPYGMNIAGANWDHSVPPTETWQAVYRTLKPGAFVLSFCNPEYYHRMAVAIEDAGFRPLDMIFWIVTTKMAKKNRLKPAHEPIMVAQKPLVGSIQKNQEQYGCGAINIEQARVPWEKEPPKGWIGNSHQRRTFGSSPVRVDDQEEKVLVDANPNGRYPTNVIGHFDDSEHQKYFYAPRATRKERAEYNDHPTPKPIDLMRYLIRIYSPDAGTVLDPFMGSGSTGIACLQENRSFVGIDISDHYVDIARQRIEDYRSQPIHRLFDYE